MGINLPDVDVGSNFIVEYVVLFYSGTCVLSTDNQVKCFGNNGQGSLGIGDTANRGDNANEMGDNLPTLTFPSDFVPVTLSGGFFTLCAVSADARLCCWGRGSEGQIGQGSSANQLTPTLVDLGVGFAVDFVSAGYKSNCAVSTDGAMKVCADTSVAFQETGSFVFRILYIIVQIGFPSECDLNAYSPFIRLVCLFSTCADLHTHF